MNPWEIVHAHYGDPERFIGQCEQLLNRYPEVRQAHVAARMGVAQVRLWEWFKRKKAPTIRSMAHMDEALTELIEEAEKRRTIIETHGGA